MKKFYETKKYQNKKYNETAYKFFPEIIKKYKKQRSIELSNLTDLNYRKIYYEKNKGKIKEINKKYRNNCKKLTFDELMLLTNPNVSTGEIQTQVYTTPSGYQFTVLFGKTYYVHRLIWSFYFYSKIPKDLEINHKNGIKNDNRIENLEIVSHDENMKHAAKNKLMNPKRKYKNSEEKRLAKIEKAKIWQKNHKRR